VIAPRTGKAPGKETDDDATGLPWLKTWRAVYAVVLASFVLWVGLLFALGVIFR
jgi:hypothetical protein